VETNINANVETSLETKHTIDLSDRLYKLPIAMITVIGLIGAGWAFLQFSELPQNAPHEINVTGEGKAYAKPDVAIVSFGAHTEAPKSQEAVAKNNAIMDAVIEAVKDLGVKDEDIQTTMYNLQPVYDYNVQPLRAMSYPYPGGGTTVLRGYALDQQIQVKIRNFDNINAILDVAAKNGANTISSLQFTVDDMEKLKAEAREKAIKQAKEKATSMFQASGLNGAKVVNISEGYAYPYGMGGTVMLEKAADAAPAPNIQAGQMEINTTVTLTYRVR